MSSFKSWWVLLLLLSLVAAPGARAQDDDPIKHVLRIYHRDIPDGLELYAENQQGTDLTVEVELDAKNVVSSPPLPTKFIIEGHQTRTIARVTRDDPKQSWRCSYRWHWCYGRNDANHDPQAVYELPYASGQKYKIVQGFHGTFSHFGQDDFALDFGMPEGSQVMAARAGTVVFVCQRFSEGAPQEYYRNRVNTVRIKHDDGTMAEYCHFRFNGVEVKEGERVQVGHLLGYSGHTGYAAGPHLHFLVYKAVDGHHRQGFPIVFKVQGESEPLILQEGRVYTHP